MITLKEFIAKDNTLLTATGVFGALVAVFTSSEIYSGSILIPFSIFLMFYLLCTEIIDDLPEWNESSTKLKIFRISLILFVLQIWYIILFIYAMEFLMTNIRIILFVIYAGISGKLLMPNKLFTNIEKKINKKESSKYHRLSYLLLILFLIIFILTANFLLAVYTEKYVIYILNYKFI